MSKPLCKKYHIRPQKKKGQNFLVGKDVLEKIIQTANLSSSDLILEIGPGFGVLTEKLAKRVKKVIAVELDKRLVKVLKESMKNYRNVRIIEGDILQFPIPNLQFPVIRYKLMANLPYSITSPVLQKFLSQEPRPSEIILLLQKEVAERIVAKPGQMSFLSVLVQFYGKPEMIMRVPRSSFWPEPKIGSALIKITQIDTKKNTEKRRIDEKKFFRIIKIGFANRRKQLRNNLSKGLKIKKEKIEKALKSIGLNFKARAQDLGVEDWIRLIEVLGSQ